MNLLQLLFIADCYPAVNVGRTIHMTVKPGSGPAKFLADKINYTSVFQVAGCGDNDVVRSIELLEELDHFVSVQSVNGLLCSQDWPPEWLVFPEILHKD